jgi:prepilin-type N-terminal cleavage/methylation domain-containing protein
MKPSIPAGRLHQIISAKERPTRGFTLPELLVVVGTLAVLSLLLVPALAGTRTDLRRLQCQNNTLSNTLLIQGDWSNFGGPVVATNGTMVTRDPAPPDPQRFYRILLQ